MASSSNFMAKCVAILRQETSQCWGKGCKTHAGAQVLVSLYQWYRRGGQEVESEARDLHWIHEMSLYLPFIHLACWPHDLAETLQRPLIITRLFTSSSNNSSSLLGRDPTREMTVDDHTHARSDQTSFQYVKLEVGISGMISLFFFCQALSRLAVCFGLRWKTPCSILGLGKLEDEWQTENTTVTNGSNLCPI